MPAELHVVTQMSDVLTRRLIDQQVSRHPCCVATPHRPLPPTPHQSSPTLTTPRHPSSPSPSLANPHRPHRLLPTVTAPHHPSPSLTAATAPHRPHHSSPALATPHQPSPTLTNPCQPNLLDAMCGADAEAEVPGVSGSCLTPPTWPSLHPQPQLQPHPQP